MRSIVNEHVNEPRPDEHADNEVCDKSVERPLAETREAAPDAAPRDRKPNDISDDVHDSVPTECHGSDAKDLRRNPRVGNCHEFEPAAWTAP